MLLRHSPFNFIFLSIERGIFHNRLSHTLGVVNRERRAAGQKSRSSPYSRKKFPLSLMCKMDEFASFNLLFFLRFKCCLFCFSVFPAFFSSFFSSFSPLGSLLFFFLFVAFLICFAHFTLMCSKVRSCSCFSLFVLLFFFVCLSIFSVLMLWSSLFV